MMGVTFQGFGESASGFNIFNRPLSSCNPSKTRKREREEGSSASSALKSHEVPSRDTLVGKKNGAASGALGASLGLLRALMMSNSARCFQCDSETDPLSVMRLGVKGSTIECEFDLARLAGLSCSSSSASDEEGVGEEDERDGFIKSKAGWIDGAFMKMDEK